MSTGGSPLAGGPSLINAPIVDPKTGTPTFQFVKWFQDASQRLQNGLNQLGQLIGIISADTKISGRSGTIGTALQNLSGAGELNATALTGVLKPAQLPAAMSTTQGAVVLPTAATSNALGSAALADSSDFDAAGSAASALSTAEAFAANASNLSNGIVPIARLPIATTGAVGAVKPDGSTLAIDGAGTLSVSALSPLVGWSVGSGAVGTNVGNIQAARRDGNISQCVLTVTASDAANDLRIDILQNGVSVFSATPLVAHGTLPGVVMTFALKTPTVAVAFKDAFSLSIISGSTAWQFAVYVE